MTRDGDIPIRNLAGGTHCLLTTGGNWVNAPVKSFGLQQLWRIGLSRNGVRKEIFATKEHRWFVYGRAADTSVGLADDLAVIVVLRLPVWRQDCSAPD
jgi:hypothetical protein